MASPGIGRDMGDLSLRQRREGVAIRHIYPGLARHAIAAVVVEDSVDLIEAKGKRPHVSRH